MTRPRLRNFQTRRRMIDRPVEPNDVFGMAPVDDLLGSRQGLAHLRRVGQGDRGAHDWGSEGRAERYRKHLPGDRARGGHFLGLLAAIAAAS
jgi:hypothetical protein